MDIEDIAGKGKSPTGIPVATKRKHGQMTLGSSFSNIANQNSSQQTEGPLSQTWKEVLGEPPQWGPNKVNYSNLHLRDSMEKKSQATFDGLLSSSIKLSHSM